VGVISIVNGYVCTNCADVANAKRGEDPHPSPVKEAQDAAKADKANELDRAARIDDPAVVFGGALASIPSIQEASAIGTASDVPTSPQANAQRVDIFA